SNNTSDQNVARFAFNGGRDMSGLVLIDGIPATAGDWGGLLASPSIESVQEVQVSRNSYDAEFGKSGGGVVSVVTKGGSNEFHGSLFEFLRNDNLDANAWANNRAGRPRVEFKRHQFGGNLAGPLWKRKQLFFLATYEGLKQGSPATTTQTVPTELERQGNFSNTRNPDGSLAVIYDPFTTRPNPNGSGFVRDPFPGNIIPRDRWDAVGAKVLELFPRPNATPTNAVTQANNFFGAGTAIVDNGRVDGRLDWVKSERWSMYGRVTYAEQQGSTPRFFGTGGDSGSEGTAPRYHATFGTTWVPSPVWVVNLTLGSGRWREEQLPVTLVDNVLGTSLGLPAQLVSQWDSPHMPQFNVAGYATLSNGRILNFPRRTDNLQLNATREFGAHSLRFGFSGENSYLNSIDVRSADFAFDRGMTSGPVAAVSSSSSGNSVASLLLGTGIGAAATGATGGVTAVNNAVTNRVQPAPLSRYFGVYLQDNWRVNTRLTLNLGLRWEQQRPRTERYNRYNYFDTSVRNPLSERTGLDLRGGLVFVGEDDRGQTELDTFDLAPRFGFAYKLTNKIVARGGYGLFYLQACCNALQGGPAAGTDGFTVTTNWVTSRGGDGITPQDLLSNPFPSGLNQPVGASRGLLTQTGSDVTAVQRARPTGYTQNFSLDLQFELDRNSVLEIGYSGVLGRKLNLGGLLNINQLPAEYLSLGNALNDQVANPFFGIFSTGVLSGATVPRHRLLRPYPQFNTVELNGDTPGATSNFNALYIKYNKTFTRGLSILSSYQFSKAIDDASENQGWIINERFRDAYNRRLDRSISAHDVPHSFAATLIYEIPVGRGRSLGGSLPRAAEFVVGGWDIASTFRFASGLPLRLEAPNSLATYGFSILNAQVDDMRAVAVDDPTPGRWFNTGAVRSPAPFTLGNAPRFASNLRADGTHHADVNLAKNFSISEQWRVQFRAEAYNITNTPQFAPPGVTVGAADFGQVNGTRFNDRRNLQFGLKLLF
ncbi:MAG TPA: TonB-dependent receptor, partial [Bryobacteraceae bacterium]|nr:TonB-dependent receptor [Bryobacteraceae bacterium]